MSTTRRTALPLLALALLLAGLACLGSSGGPTGPLRRDLSNYTPIPVTANTLPPEWTATPDETATPIPGWKQFNGRGVSVWLPETFFGGDPSSDLAQLIEQLRILGGHFAQAADTLEANPGGFLLWVVNQLPGDSGALTNMTAVKEEVPPDISMQEYLEALLGQFPAEYQVLESGTISLARYPEAAKVVFETNALGSQLKEVVYLVKQGGTVWGVTYATGAAEFEQWLPTFEQSISTLSLQP